MDAQLQGRMAMLGRVAEYLAANPDEFDAQGVPVVRFHELRARAQDLDEVFRVGVLDRTGFTRYKAEFRRQLHDGVLQHIRSTALIAAREQRELAARYKLPGIGASQQAFLTAARSILAKATEDQAMLEKHGLRPGTIAELAAQLAEYEEVVERQRGSQRAHVDARAQLAVVMREALAIVRQLGTLARLRFAEHPARLAAWKSAAKVIVRSPETRKEASPAA